LAGAACRQLGVRLTVHTALTAALTALTEASGGNDPYRIALMGKDSMELDADIVALSLQDDPVLRTLPLIRFDDFPSAMPRESRLFRRILDLPCHTEDLAEEMASAMASTMAPAMTGTDVHAATLLSLAGCRALVVDDDSASRMAASNMLEARGCVTVQAANGAEACAMLEAGDYDLVLMDVEMPVLDGKQATRRIRASHRHAANTRSGTSSDSSPVIIAVTSSASPSERQDCLKAGMNDFIAKPLKASTLERHLARWFASDVPIHPDHPDYSSAKLMESLVPHDKQQEQENDRLAEVREEFGPVFAELASLYRQDGPPRIDAMRRELEVGNNVALAKFAHALGGSSASIGASGLADQCRELEILARSSLPDDAAARIDAIARAYQRIAGKLDNMTR
jgi:CheY-like chemotaxis protein